MCGIFGFAKREGWQSESQMNRIEDIVSNLTFESAIRGKDSTGLAIASNTEKMVYKTLKSSDQLVCDDEWSDILEKIDKDTTVFLGHVRYKTTGDITEQNAHPFVKGSVIGAHNGIIYNHEEIAKKLNKDVQVDSEVIFALLNKKEKYKEVFDVLEGDYALSWIDEDYRNLYLMHEEGRPLYIAYWKKARCLFWASTKEILSLALKDAGLCINTSELPVDTVFEFNTGEFWNNWKAKTVEVETNANFYQNSYYGVDRNYSSYGTSKYMKYDYNCKICSVTTYDADGICYKCKTGDHEESLRLNNKGVWVANCSDCKAETNSSSLILSNGYYVCDYCESKKYTNNSYKNINNMESCDFCGDYEPYGHMSEYSNQKMCDSCYTYSTNTGNITLGVNL
tara:strand:- start:13807 stop:14991 length:1185 start_codon:yes stop_codon:yes gene_type:complete